MIRKIQHKQIVRLSDQIEIRKHEVVSKTLCQNTAVSVTLFAFDIEEEISTHASGGDAMVQVLEGKAKITIDQLSYKACEGEAIIMPANVPHALYAIEPCKLLLTVVFL